MSVIVPPKRTITPAEIRDILSSRISHYESILQELKSGQSLDVLETKNEFLKSKIQEFSLEALEDLTMISKWKLSMPSYVSKDIETFLDYLKEARWCISLYNSTEQIYG